MASFLKELALDAGVRLPGQRRFKKRATGFQEGVNVPDVIVEEIRNGIARSWR